MRSHPLTRAPVLPAGCNQLAGQRCDGRQCCGFRLATCAAFPRCRRNHCARTSESRFTSPDGTSWRCRERDTVGRQSLPPNYFARSGRIRCQTAFPFRRFQSARLGIPVLSEDPALLLSAPRVFFATRRGSQL